MKQYSVLIGSWVSFCSSLPPTLSLLPLVKFDQNFLREGLGDEFWMEEAVEIGIKDMIIIIKHANVKAQSFCMGESI